MIGFLRKNYNNPIAAFGASSAGNSALPRKTCGDSSSASNESQDISIGDVKARQSNRQQADDSGSERNYQCTAPGKMAGLSLLQVGGIGGAGAKAPLTTRTTKNAGGALRSRNGGFAAKFFGQTFGDDCAPSKDSELSGNIPTSARGGLFATQRGSLALEGGAAEIAGGMTSFNNARGTFRKKMSNMNNDGLSMRER
jgi:hypothetical protein